MTYEKIGLENLPNAYINKIQIRACFEGTPGASAVVYTANPRISIYDYQKRYGSAWRHQKNLSRFLQVEVTLLCAIGSTAKAQVGSLIAGEIFLKNLKNTENILMTSTSFAAKDFVAFGVEEDGLERFSHYFSWPLTSIHLTAQQYIFGRPDIYMFAQCFVDVDGQAGLKSVYGGDYDYTEHQHYYGPLTAEKIFHDAAEVTQARLFYTKKGAMSTQRAPTTTRAGVSMAIESDIDRVSYGAVHSHDGVYMEGSFHSSNPHLSLNELIVDGHGKFEIRDCEDALSAGTSMEEPGTTDGRGDSSIEDEPELTGYDDDSGMDTDAGDVDDDEKYDPNEGEPDPDGDGGDDDGGTTGPSPGNGDDDPGVGAIPDPSWDPI